MIAVKTIEWTLGSLVVVLVLIGLLFWLTRDRKNKRLRVGFFLEREPFPKDEFPGRPPFPPDHQDTLVDPAEQDTVAGWPKSDE